MFVNTNMHQAFEGKIEALNEMHVKELPSGCNVSRIFTPTGLLILVT